MKNAKDFENFKKNIEFMWDQTTIYPGLIFDKNCPARGQCEPTVCLVQDLFGGVIYKIEGDKSIAPKKTHYYNYIDGEFIDLTAEQFSNKVPYEKGVELTEKQACMLRKTSYCNRMVRYQCLKNNFKNMDNIINDKKAKTFRAVGNFFEDAAEILMKSPWLEIENWFPELFRLITFIIDCNYDRKIGLFEHDTMRVIESFLKGYYFKESEEIIKNWKEKIISENGLKFLGMVLE